MTGLECQGLNPPIGPDSTMGAPMPGPGEFCMVIMAIYVVMPYVHVVNILACVIYIVFASMLSCTNAIILVTILLYSNGGRVHYFE